MAKSLIIVESPAKARTINKFLGNSFKVESSMGHVMDLPKSVIGVDVEKDFKPRYVIIPARKKILNLLKKEAKEAQKLYLATDPDREGEAISWHLKEAMGKGKDIYRLEFHEITKKAIEDALKHPRDIDINLVNAQQARRILDRIVGYSLSPLLWKNVRQGLSAGRVQSVAVRLVVEREREIRAFKAEEYWTIDAEFKKEKASFKARLEKIDDKKAEIKNKSEADDLVSQITKEKFVVASVDESKKKRNPSAPFTTSKLQQEAFNKLRFPVHKTMKVAQELYEGIDIGEEGPVGLITYMRTDSVVVANEAIHEVRGYIGKEFGKDYLPDAPIVYKSKKSAQGAHEAIRPTAVSRTPESIKDFLSADQLKLYELIWKKFVSSQMTPALFLATAVDIKAGRFTFRARGQRLIFEGFLKVYGSEKAQEDKTDKSGEEEEALTNELPALVVNEALNCSGLFPEQHFTKPPARYSDASLVKALEEKGIGRPSTYAPTIYTIITRRYAERESGYLKPTELGEDVTDILIKHFPKILDVKFTAGMEDELDSIEEGKADWIAVLKEFYKPFSEKVAEAKLEMKSIKKAPVPTDEVCEKCGSPMVIKWGRNGKFLSCSKFPECKNAKSITSGVKCPNEGCGGELIRRRSKRGQYFYGCSNFPKCRYVSSKLPGEGQEPKSENQI